MAKKIDKMTNEQVLESLRRSGIITKAGKLAAKYKKK
jgi:hypothetical protein